MHGCRLRKRYNARISWSGRTHFMSSPHLPRWNSTSSWKWRRVPTTKRPRSRSRAQDLKTRLHGGVTTRSRVRRGNYRPLKILKSTRLPSDVFGSVGGSFAAIVRDSGRASGDRRGTAAQTHARDYQQTRPTSYTRRRSSPGARTQRPTVRARPLKDSVPHAGGPMHGKVVHSSSLFRGRTCAARGRVGTALRGIFVAAAQAAK